MPETVMPLTDRRNIWLSSLAGEVSSIFADCWLEQRPLRDEESETLGELDTFLDKARRGLEYKSNNGSRLSFERRTLEDLQAMRSVALIANSVKEITEFLDKLHEVITDLRTGTQVNRNLLFGFRETLEELSLLASEEPSNPEASHAL